MRRYFITATGTDIGKTFVTCALVHAARKHGKSLEVYKPIISGIEDDNPAGSDSALLLEALGREVTPANLDVISPWRFKEALAPSMAAAKEGKEFPITELFEWTHNTIQNFNQELMLIEGVGGVMVPLDTHHTVCDWMMVASLTSILVAGSYLGTISHTLTALETLEHAGIAVRAVVVCESPNSTVALEDTLRELRIFVPESTQVIALPQMKSYEDACPLVEGLLE